MSIEFFLDSLKSLQFDKEVLKKKGFDEEDITEMLDAFIPSRKCYDSSSSDISIKFIEEYETNFSLISNISFNNEVIISDKNVIIGWVKGEDPLAINKQTSEVVTVINWDYDEINFYCASTGAAFMQAFLIHGVGRLDIDFKTEEERWLYNLSKSKEAAKVAGGEKYLQFWQSLYPIGEAKTGNYNSEFLN